MVGFLADENTTEEPVFAAFLGTLAATSPMAAFLQRRTGAPIAVVSSEDKYAYCEKLGAKGCINRKDFDHWGMLPHWKEIRGLLSRMADSVSQALESSSRIDAFVEWVMVE